MSSYLKRSEKTLRGWEEREGLPVYRLFHEKRGSVFVYTRELDAWWESRKLKEVVPAKLSKQRSPRPSTKGPAQREPDANVPTGDRTVA